MGEYIKHPMMEEEEEIKVGVCRGRDWETFYTKRILEEFRNLGFKNWYGGGFNEDSHTLDDFISKYDIVDSSYIRYSDLMQVETRDFDKVKEILLHENIGFVLWKNGKVLVTDSRFVDKLIKLAGMAGVVGITVSNYEYLAPDPVFFQVCNDCQRKFRVRYFLDGSYEYVDEPCDCECSFSPCEDSPSISEWLESVRKK